MANKQRDLAKETRWRETLEDNVLIVAHIDLGSLHLVGIVL